MTDILPFLCDEKINKLDGRPNSNRRSGTPTFHSAFPRSVPNPLQVGSLPVRRSACPGPRVQIGYGSEADVFQLSHAPKRVVRIQKGTIHDLEAWGRIHQVTKRMSELRITVPMYDAWVRPSSDGEYIFYMIMAKGTPITDETDLPPFAVDSLYELVHRMHDNGIFHNDLGRRNLIQYNNEIRIVDFGLCLDMKSAGMHVPELFRISDYFSLIFGQTIVRPDASSPRKWTFRYEGGIQPVCDMRTVRAREFPAPIQPAVRRVQTILKKNQLPHLMDIIAADLRYADRLVRLLGESKPTEYVHVPRNMSLMVTMLDLCSPCQRAYMTTNLLLWDLYRVENDPSAQPARVVCPDELFA
jgi:hypothetical protein